MSACTIVSFFENHLKKNQGGIGDEKTKGSQWMTAVAFFYLVLFAGPTGLRVVPTRCLLDFWSFFGGVSTAGNVNWRALADRHGEWTCSFATLYSLGDSRMRDEGTRMDGTG